MRGTLRLSFTAASHSLLLFVRYVEAETIINDKLVEARREIATRPQALLTVRKLSDALSLQSVVASPSEKAVWFERVNDYISGRCADGNRMRPDKVSLLSACGVAFVALAAFTHTPPPRSLPRPDPAKEPDENGHFSDSGDDREDEDAPVFHSGRMMSQDELRVSRLRSALVQLTDVCVRGHFAVGDW